MFHRVRFISLLPWVLSTLLKTEYPVGSSQTQVLVVISSADATCGNVTFVVNNPPMLLYLSAVQVVQPKLTL